MNKQKTSGKVGSINFTNSGVLYKVVKKEGSQVWLEFYGSTPHCPLKPLRESQLFTGMVRDVLSPSGKHGGVRGYLGNCQSKEYVAWRGVMDRTNSPLQESYTQTKITEEFKDFENFYNWFQKNKCFSDDSFEVDKDLFSYGNYKVYSSHSCCLLPKEINYYLGHPSDKTVYYDGNSYYLVSLCGEILRKEDFSFASAQEAVDFANDYLTFYLKILADKYRNQLLPYVYNRLLDYKFNLNYVVCRRFLKSDGKRISPRKGVSDKRAKQDSLARSFLTRRTHE